MVIHHADKTHITDEKHIFEPEILMQCDVM